jgi:hypothetical protein
LKEAEQVAPQVMPAGLLVTVPLPVPVLLTLSTGGAKVTHEVPSPTREVS